MQTTTLTRSDFQKLAEVRIEEAKILLDNKKYDGAYYLVGYAIEFALKACIAKNVKQYDYFPDPKKVQNIYKHKANEIIAFTGLDNELVEKKKNPKFALYWKVLESWNVETRYATHTEKEARELYQAIADPTEGILTWLKTQW